MKLDINDILTINWAGIREVRVANGLDNISNGDKIKVIMNGDNSYNPITIDRSCIIAVNGKEI